LEKQVKVIVHQRPRKDLPSAPCRDATEELQPSASILIIPHDTAALNAATGHMVHGV
jgi:hypothetical protein